MLNRILKLDFCYEGLTLDLNSLFNSYKETSVKWLEANEVNEWSNLNKNILNQANIFSVSFGQAEKDTKEALALLRVYYKHKKMSPYRFLLILNKELFLDISEERIREEIEIMNKEQAEKNKPQTEDNNDD